MDYKYPVKTLRWSTSLQNPFPKYTPCWQLWLLGQSLPFAEATKIAIQGMIHAKKRAKNPDQRI